MSSSSTGTTTFLYDGDALVAEYDGSTMLRRHLHWPGADTPELTFDGAGFTQPHWLHADERGTIVASSDGNGTATINRFDEYGLPAAANSGRFGFTGQLWLPEIGLYYYRARIYSPTLGRFMQTDPIGYGGGMNFHAYVGNDSVNSTDPSGERPFNPRELRMFGPMFPGLNFSRISLELTGLPGAYVTRNSIYMSSRSGGLDYSLASLSVRASLVHERFHHFQMQIFGLTYNDIAFSHAAARLVGEDPYAYTIYPGSTLRGCLPAAQARIVERCFTSGNASSAECQLIERGNYGINVAEILAVGHQLASFTLLDHILGRGENAWTLRFGHGGTMGLIYYLLHCVVGEVDICEGNGPGVGPQVDPREIPTHPVE